MSHGWRTIAVRRPITGLTSTSSGDDPAAIPGRRGLRAADRRRAARPSPERSGAGMEPASADDVTAPGPRVAVAFRRNAASSPAEPGADVLRPPDLRGARPAAKGNHRARDRQADRRRRPADDRA